MSQIIGKDHNKRKLSTDKNNTNETNKELKVDIEYKHIYYEPRMISDIEVVYGTTIFHLHKYILLSQGGYFKNLIESYPKLKTITLPLVSGYNVNDEKLTMTDHQFTKWLNGIYFDDVNFEDVFNKNWFDEFYIFLFFTNYFQSKELQEKFERHLEHYIYECNKNEMLDFDFIIFYLKMLDHYQWLGSIDYITNHIIDNAKYFHTSEDFNEEKWMTISVNIREEIYRRSFMNEIAKK